MGKGTSKYKNVKGKRKIPPMARIIMMDIPPIAAIRYILYTQPKK